MAVQSLNLEDWWPDLFEGLDENQRWNIVQTFVANWHEGWEPNRHDVARLTAFVRGDITREEYIAQADMAAEKFRR